MINKEHGEELEARKVRKMRNKYNDLWFFIIIIIYLIFCKFNFNTFNPFSSTWSYFRIATNNGGKSYTLSKTTDMIKTSYRKGYIEVLKNDLSKSNFKLIEEQTHELIFDKGGVKFTYSIDERNLFGVNYSLVIMEEEEQKY